VTCQRFKFEAIRKSRRKGGSDVHGVCLGESREKLYRSDYVALDESAPRTVIGYFTPATASVPRDNFPKKYVRGLPPYDLPLILLARRI